MQLISKGYKNRVSSKYLFDSGKLQMSGGCSSYRTLEIHNKALLFLKTYPKYVKVSKRSFKTGALKIRKF